MIVRCWVEGIERQLGEPFDFLRTDGEDALLSTEHAPQGRPVVVRRGVTYRPGDLPGLRVHVLSGEIGPELLADARAAGWEVVCAGEGDTGMEQGQ